MKILTNDEVIKKLKLNYGDSLDYNKVQYINIRNKITLICPLHGEFWQSPTDYRACKGCPICGNIHRANKNRISQEEFERRANKKWNNHYQYGTYKGMHSYIEVTCPKHGVFLVTPHNHLVDCECPQCSMSSKELLIYKFLDLNNIQYIFQYPILIDKNINPSGIAKIDFYLPKYNIFIEYNGIQHYVPIKHFGGELKFKQQQSRDEYIRKYCKDNNIKLIEFSYKLNSEQIISKLTSIINNGQI